MGLFYADGLPSSAGSQDSDASIFPNPDDLRLVQQTPESGAHDSRLLALTNSWCAKISELAYLIQQDHPVPRGFDYLCVQLAALQYGMRNELKTCPVCGPESIELCFEVPIKVIRYRIAVLALDGFSAWLTAMIHRDQADYKSADPNRYFRITVWIDTLRPPRAPPSTPLRTSNPLFSLGIILFLFILFLIAFRSAKNLRS
ncbi:hypothetical protein DL766_006334 [Monosporascus sp. MC13-8B]|uniref:Uncharacterized protein n=1 Tax=Monosporascus cannonballus TaxID=155416 RepID=A0ABY0H4N5_9PEZI|nr:hypothetical protein DL762_006588 [Monosporascus cannonballus]RYO90175.1 hypothetical protein DL763_005416 [Monosporascus cannonballus]RYP27550.1 hypothetical protein DL766_006334 [Monosporascus sp. MC13-8B]